MIFKIAAFTIKDKNEVGWFYCSASSSEIDRYVIYNYAEDLWFYGQLVRTAWLDAGIENYPRAVNGGFLFQQENYSKKLDLMNANLLHTIKRTSILFI